MRTRLQNLAEKSPEIATTVVRDPAAIKISQFYERLPHGRLALQTAKPAFFRNTNRFLLRLTFA